MSFYGRERERERSNYSYLKTLSILFLVLVVLSILDTVIATHPYIWGVTLVVFVLSILRIEINTDKIKFSYNIRNILKKWYLNNFQDTNYLYY